MPLNDPDCQCPYPYRVQVGSPTVGREVKWFVCCALSKLEELTGTLFHELMYDVEPFEPGPPCGPSRPVDEWPYGERIIAEKRSKGFVMKVN